MKVNGSATTSTTIYSRRSKEESIITENIDKKWNVQVGNLVIATFFPDGEEVGRVKQDETGFYIQNASMKRRGVVGYLKDADNVEKI